MPAHCSSEQTEASPIKPWSWARLQASEMIAEVRGGGKTIDELCRSIEQRLLDAKAKGAAEARKKR